MTAPGAAPPGPPPFLLALEEKEVKLIGLVGANCYAFGQNRPLGRIRAYTSAGLGPFAGRGMPSEMHLLGHVHLDEEGRVSRLEGFNGAEGERWAKGARERLVKEGVLAPGAVVTPLTPLRGCPFTGIR